MQQFLELATVASRMSRMRFRVLRLGLKFKSKALYYSWVLGSNCPVSGLYAMVQGCKHYSTSFRV